MAVIVGSSEAVCVVVDAVPGRARDEEGRFGSCFREMVEQIGAKLVRSVVEGQGDDSRAIALGDDVALAAVELKGDGSDQGQGGKEASED